ncbi:MAG: multifunctional oxoglutarate decarboxylase/oxoglutarate dehydrogenase thiamine pyrophosphate-binding subunit/dihydrolipoyllysine-residue succinyltransferase subunit, partial [Microbacteriaceae bacterium]|nr:multifunctional oxoglutarate decarboxylase/oxoglutarate dehydrogenase thiamine pyrophosphate-binding subunit/dihydrolipoyllysine-residue succinyltransferase subunit [Microbacteriaceae bacterium]
MSSQETSVGAPNDGEFGANEWLVDELYEQFKVDRNAVDKAWWPVLENYRPLKGEVAGGLADASAETVAAASADAAAAPTTSEAHPMTAPIPVIGAQPVARTTSAPAKPQPIPAQAPPLNTHEPRDTADQDVITPLRGMSKTLAANMDESLAVPTATSVRTIPAKLMIDNRIVINSHMARTRGGKVSFTHLIG